jgi:phosphoglycolate phosphatase-like HAD superfamily hydrolase
MCDFDGTLFDSMPSKAEAMYRMFVERYPEVVGDRAVIVECFMDNSGHSTADMIEATAKCLGVRPSADEMKVMRDRYWDHEKPLVRVHGGFFQDTEELAGLASHGVAVAITTGTRHEDLRELVAEANLRHVFSFIGGFSTRREEQGRPFTKGRAHLEFIARRLKGRVPPIYYYGDSVRDIHVAKEVGAKKMFFRQGSLGAREIDAEIKKHPDLEILRVSNSLQVVETIAREVGGHKGPGSTHEPSPTACSNEEPGSR